MTRDDLQRIRVFHACPVCRDGRIVRVVNAGLDGQWYLTCSTPVTYDDERKHEVEQ